MGCKDKVKSSKALLWIFVSYLLLLSPSSLADYGYLSEQRVEREEYRQDLEQARTEESCRNNECSCSSNARYTPSSRTDTVLPCTDVPSASRQREGTKEGMNQAKATPARISLLWYLLGLLSVSVGAAALVLFYYDRHRLALIYILYVLKWVVGAVLLVSSPFWLFLPGPDLPPWASYTLITIPGWAVLILATIIGAWFARLCEREGIGILAVLVLVGFSLLHAVLGDTATGLIFVAVVIVTFAFNPLLIFLVVPFGLLALSVSKTLGSLAATTDLSVSIDVLLVILRIAAAGAIPAFGVYLMIELDVERI